MENGSIKDFFKSKGEYSHTRLISIVGSFIVFGVLINNPLNDGLQEITMWILVASLTNASASKFTEIYGNRRKRTEPNQKV